MRMCYMVICGLPGPNVMKIFPVGAEEFHADWRTDMTQIIVPFRDFARAPKTAGKRCHWKSLCPFWESLVEILPTVSLPSKIQSSVTFNA